MAVAAAGRANDAGYRTLPAGSGWLFPLEAAAWASCSKARFSEPYFSEPYFSEPYFSEPYFSEMVRASGRRICSTTQVSTTSRASPASRSIVST